MMKRTLTTLTIAWLACLALTPQAQAQAQAQRAEAAPVERLSLKTRVTVQLDGGPQTQRFDGPFDFTEEVAGAGVATARSQSEVGDGILTTITTNGRRAMVDFDSIETFRFTDTSRPLMAYFELFVWSDATLRGDGSLAAIGYALRLYAPDGRPLVQDVWSESTHDGVSTTWSRDMGEVSFLVEPGVYRLEVDGVAISRVPPHISYSRTRLLSSVYFVVTPVPEPSSWALLLSGLGVAGVAAPRRRRAEGSAPVRA